MRKLLLPRGAVNAVYLPYLQSPRRYQIFFGGASSGKSCFLATRAVLDTLQGRSTLVIRQVARTLRTSCWNEIGKAAARLGLTGCFRFNKTEMTVTARNNGAQILFAGLDDVEKIKSISPAGGALTDIWIEEATEISYADFKQLDKRLRGQSRHEKRLTLSFNPVYKTHWIYREFFGGWDEGGRAYQSDTVSILKTTYQDNAFLTADDRAALENERDPYYRQVYTLGDWGVLGDVIFRAWRQEELHARAAAPVGSSPTASRPAFWARPMRFKSLSTAHHLPFQLVVKLRRDGGLQRPLQRAGLSRPLQALEVGTEVRAAPRLFALEVQRDPALGRADHADQLTLLLPLAAAHTLALREFFHFLHGTASPPNYSSSL